MAKPSSRILVINDEHLELREFVKGLNAAARQKSRLAHAIKAMS